MSLTWLGSLAGAAWALCADPEQVRKFEAAVTRRLGFDAYGYLPMDKARAVLTVLVACVLGSTGGYILRASYETLSPAITVWILAVLAMAAKQADHSMLQTYKEKLKAFVAGGSKASE